MEVAFFVASRRMGEMPTWFVATQAVLVLISHIVHFRFKNPRTDQFESKGMIYFGAFTIAFLSLWLTLGENYIPKTRIPVPFIGDVRLVKIIDLHQFRYLTFLVSIIHALRYGWQMARQRAQVINPPPLNSIASFRLEIRALRMIQAAPSLRDALREEMSNLRNGE